MSTNKKIVELIAQIERELIKKNNDYGDSLQNPIGVFQNNRLDGILGRIDDKLNRIKNVGINNKTEDSIGDLIGYLIHLKIMLKDER